ncbi:hypothetical protein B0H16DRAFT_1507218 [Mycena metata]|uniref:Uncharacterized protein n=1 Tax=Mycena metata TaxID=1033252 RepID=A0AAD7NUB4_9AGAR|nr:hypothetical protein B0H16DRAFT_1507218 [Mycena metata]
MLPMGDIDLQRELMVNTQSGVVESRRERNCVRRVYSARVIGRNSNLTVAIYQGNGAEEDWRRDTKMYMSVRRVLSNVLTLVGAECNSAIRISSKLGQARAMEMFTPRCSMAVQHPISSVRLEVNVFLDLVPLRAFLARQSPIMAVYLYACYTGEWIVRKFKFKLNPC